MTSRQLAEHAKNVLKHRAAWGGSQNFLGARWVEHVIRATPTAAREQVALRFLSFSPHYFYDRDLRAESDRNRSSRRILADELVGPYLSPGTRVLDFGCGPGYLAAAVADKAAHVTALDISRGVLACARVLNGRSNITYLTPQEHRAKNEQVDLAYSLAVVQHLRTSALEQALELLAAAVRPGGMLLLHFAEAGHGWRTEDEWLADGSLAGRAKLHYGLNCFGRSAAEMEKMVTRSGFTDAACIGLGGSLHIPREDIADQHFLTARRA